LGPAGVVLGLASIAWPGAPAANGDDTALARGGQTFRTHCATCHGSTGHGDGPTAQYLRVAPADLTTIAARNRGVFPVEVVHRAIDGRRTVRAHGDSAMPIWGDAFSPSEQAAADRIRDVVTYLESIQEHPGDE
jgi:mono/diheme cytochrome c family protein